MNGWWLRSAGTGRQCAPAELIRRFLATPRLHRSTACLTPPQRVHRGLSWRKQGGVCAVTLIGRSKGSRLVAGVGPIVALALGIAIAPVLARDATPAPVRIAVFDFEIEDLSPSAALVSKPTASATTMEKVSNAAREELTQSGLYLVIDASKVDAKPVADKTLRDCAGCEAGIAQQLGAQQSLIGLVRKVTQTDYYVMIRIRDARTGKILDQEEANFAGDEAGWASGVRMLIRHQVLPNKE